MHVAVQTKKTGHKKFNQLLYKIIFKKGLKVTSQIKSVQDYYLNKK